MAPISPHLKLTFTSDKGQDCEITDEESDTAVVDKRDNPRDMVNYARYEWGTWVVLIKGFALTYYERSTWEIPADDNGISWLAASVAHVCMPT